MGPTSAPANTEIELKFTILLDGGAIAFSAKGYVETQATIPGGAPIVFTIYYDSGSVLPFHISISSIVDTSQECSSIGTCP